MIASSLAWSVGRFLLINNGTLVRAQSCWHQIHVRTRVAIVDKDVHVYVNTKLHVYVDAVLHLYTLYIHPLCDQTASSPPPPTTHNSAGGASE